MKLSKKRITEIIKQELNEFTTTAGGAAALEKLRAKVKALQQRKAARLTKKGEYDTAKATTDTKAATRAQKSAFYDTKSSEYDTALAAYNTADADRTAKLSDFSTKTSDYTTKYMDWSSKKSDYDTHVGDEPSRTIDVPDTGKWIHPYRGDTTTLGQGETQPPKGWKFDKTTTSTVADTSKWVHPKSGVTTTGTKPKKGWEYTKTTNTVSPDTSKWINPFTNVETLAKTKAQPQNIWKYDTTTTDDSKWLHPWKEKDTGTALAKGEKKPELGWRTTQTANTKKGEFFIPGTDQVQNRASFKNFGPKTTHGWSITEPGKKPGTWQPATLRVGGAQEYTKLQKDTADLVSKGKLKFSGGELASQNIAYGSGDKLAYQQATKAAKAGGYDITAQKETSFPTSTTTSYGEGSDKDYSTAYTSRHPSTSNWTKKATTNPTKTTTSTSKKYGQGSLNPKTGEFTTTE